MITFFREGKQVPGKDKTNTTPPEQTTPAGAPELIAVEVSTDSSLALQSLKGSSRWKGTPSLQGESISGNISADTLGSFIEQVKRHSFMADQSYMKLEV